MEESTTLSKTFSNNNWFSELELTGESNYEEKANMFNNSIDVYKDQIEDFLDSTKFLDKNLQKEIDFPFFSRHYDIINAKKFSKKVQRWRGVVSEIKTNTFVSKIYDLTNGGTYEIAELEIEDISPDDLPLFENGSVFYWTLGHFMENGQSIKKSEIRFQRLIQIDEHDFDKLYDEIDIKFGNLLK